MKWTNPGRESLMTVAPGAHQSGMRGPRVGLSYEASLAREHDPSQPFLFSVRHALFL